MAHMVYAGVQTAQVLSGVSNRLMLTSVELAVHAAATAVKAVRSSSTADGQKNLADHPLVKDELEAMDIEAKLKTVHALVLTIQKQRGRAPSKSNNDQYGEQIEEKDESDVVGVCLDQVKEVLESMTNTFNALNEELDAHEQRWFASWRSPDTKHHLIALKAKIVILDKRVDMLLKVRSFVGDSLPVSSPRTAPPRGNGNQLEYGSSPYGRSAFTSLTST